MRNTSENERKRIFVISFSLIVFLRNASGFISVFVQQLTSPLSVSPPQPLRGKNTVDLIVEGSVLELQDVSDPFVYWPVRVIQNIGGRLWLRYVGLTKDHQTQDIWLFYLDIRLRPLGWALENSLALEPPTGENQILWI